MSFYSFRSYINYRLKALSRHGVHSPFVFDLIENGLRKNSGKPLQEKLEKYFHDYRFIEIMNLGDKNRPDPDSVPASGKQPLPVIVIKNIHRDQASSITWKELCAHPKVTLSIDLYSYGLLLFNEEFLVKQHFILKYPA